MVRSVARVPSAPRQSHGRAATVAMTKQRIVAESRRPAKASRSEAATPRTAATVRQFVTGAAEAWQLPPAAARGDRIRRTLERRQVERDQRARAAERASPTRAARPGRTQQINFFACAAGGRRRRSAGLRLRGRTARARSRHWQAFLWSYLTTRTTLVGLVLVVDARHGLRRHSTEQVLAGFVPSGRPLLILVTKADKFNRRSAARR